MQKNIYLLVFLFLGLPLFMNAQQCPNIWAQKSWGQRLEPSGIPVTSKIIPPFHSNYGVGKTKPVPNYLKSGFKVLVLERHGDLYKVANSDLGRTMVVNSPDLELEEDSHYSLVMRRLHRNPKGDQAENATEEGKHVDWEVLSGSMR